MTTSSAHHHPPDGTERTIDPLARARGISILTMAGTGEKLFTERPRIRTENVCAVECVQAGPGDLGLARIGG